jgi:hypothetical protein
VGLKIPPLKKNITEEWEVCDLPNNDVGLVSHPLKKKI